MYERFTDRSRKVMQLANFEAQRLQHEYIGTEHILLGLIKEGSGVAAYVLQRLNVDLISARREIERLLISGPNKVTFGKLPQTPRAKNVLEYAIREAKDLNHNYVGTEHLLLGLLSERDGVAAVVLNNLGVRIDGARAEVLSVLGVGQETAKPLYDAPPETKYDPPARSFGFPPSLEFQPATDRLVKPLMILLLMSLIVNVMLAAFLWQLHFAGR
jgi:ATP-dependent Clp protease ATP-binding subunit ClpC